MCGTNDQISIRGVPCALGRYFHQHSGESALGVLTPYACKAGFLDWVEGPRQNSPDLEVEERIMCPMLWCRKPFKSVSATAHHVKTCSRLSDGWYWCPFCRHPERFLECDKSCEISRQPTIRRKGLRLCRAVNFFNCLGRRHSTREISSTLAELFMELKYLNAERYIVEGQADPEMETLIWSGFGRGELDAGPDNQLLALDLAEADYLKAQNEHPRAHWIDEKESYHYHSSDTLNMAGVEPMARSDDRPHQNRTAQALPDMYHPLTCSFQELQGSDFATRFKDQTNIVSELPGRRMTTAFLPKLDRESILTASESHRSSQLADSDYDFTAAYESLASAMSSADEHGPPIIENITSMQQALSPLSDLVSPLSPTEQVSNIGRLSSPPDPLLVPNHLQFKTDAKPLTALTTSNIVSSRGNVDPWDASPRSSAEQWPSDSNTTNANATNADSPFGARGGLWDWPLGSRQTQIEELRDLVKIVNNEWMQRLTLAPDLHSQCAALSPQVLFDKGVESLVQCLSDKFPMVFVNIFALMHVAFAAAYILHKDDLSYCWDSFFQDALDWEFSLNSQSDKAAFLGVMNLWWLTPGLSLVSSLVSKTEQALGHAGTQQNLADGILKEVIDLLKHGKIIQNCAEFLDGYKEADIIERNSQSLPGAMVSNAQGRAPIVEHMIHTITQPLQQHRGIEAFHDQVLHTEAQLRNGLLQNPREVEVVLKLSAKRISKSPFVYEKYCGVVAGLCNTAMEPSDPSWIGETSWISDDAGHDWRNRFYAAEAVSLKLDHSQRVWSSTNHWPNISVLAVIRPNATPHNSPTSPTSDSNVNSANSSPTSLASWTLANASEDEISGSSLGSPTSTSQSSISPLSPSFPTPDTEITHCQSCPATFKGNPQHRRSNLQRHLRSSRRHSGQAGLKCPEPGCSSTLKRADNLAKHLQSMHGLSNLSEKRDAIRRSKFGSRDLPSSLETFLDD